MLYFHLQTLDLGLVPPTPVKTREANTPDTNMQELSRLSFVGHNGQ